MFFRFLFWYLFLPFLLAYYGFFLYSWYKIKYSKKMTGLDKYMLDYIDQSTIYNSLRLKDTTDMERYIEKIRSNLRKLYTSYTTYNAILDVRDEITEEKETEILNKPYLSNFPPFKLIIDKKNKILWIVANHTYKDGLTLMKMAIEILDINKNDIYDIKPPKFNYVPAVTEYMIIRTAYDYFTMKPATLKSLTSNSPSILKIKNIYHLKVEMDIQNNFRELYIHKMMQMFFAIFDKVEYFNVGVLFAIDNPNKINNIAMIVLSVNRTDTVKNIGTKLYEKRHMVIGSYFWMNAVNASSKKSAVDIMISSVPLFKTDKYGDAHGAILPYITAPIYMFNSKIGNTNTTSLHVRHDYVDYNKLERTIVNTKNVTLYRVSTLY